MTAGRIALGLVFALGGGLVGWAYFTLMQYSVRRIAEDGVDAGRFVLFLLPRLALFAGGVYAAISAGPACLIGYMAGFLVTRTIIVRRARTVALRQAEPNHHNQTQG